MATLFKCSAICNGWDFSAEPITPCEWRAGEGEALFAAGLTQFARSLGIGLACFGHDNIIYSSGDFKGSPPLKSLGVPSCLFCVLQLQLQLLTLLSLHSLPVCHAPIIKAHKRYAFLMATHELELESEGSRGCGQLYLLGSAGLNPQRRARTQTR